MSSLRSGLDELHSAELRLLSDGELESRLDEIARASGVLEAEKARTVAEVERRGSFSTSGHLSITSWVEQRLQTSWGDAARAVRTARALEAMPVVREALYEGEVSPSAVSQLVVARDANPEEFALAEEILVDAARTLPSRDLRRAVTHWRDVVDAGASARADRQRWDRRGLHVSPMLDGMVRVDGNLDAESGETLITALRSITDAWARSHAPDDRSPAQRRCDALGEMARGWLDRSDRPVVGGERPHLTVRIDLDSLQGHGSAELSEAGQISSETARRIACDARVSRVITKGSSEPLDVGRSTRVIPPALRRAVVARDHECRFPGCDRPPPWCDAHHVLHWADGGETKLRNLVLLCRRHHRMLHEGFGLEVTNSGPVFTRPDGSMLDSGSVLEAGVVSRAPP
jgi:hypothetical protein